MQCSGRVSRQEEVSVDKNETATVCGYNGDAALFPSAGVDRNIAKGLV